LDLNRREILRFAQNDIKIGFFRSLYKPVAVDLTGDAKETTGLVRRGGRARTVSVRYGFHFFVLLFYYPLKLILPVSK
jgi:hypothetical protein